ncbi:M protein repeat protein [Arthroderma uncinatum]|uniref:M protein repeat protein n=1 Tax=Arthroderma uncinatum TaxID=74035 RepID=UPI00144A5826|nr:M protein repeat protein [Arthroderma uncinatum]KAF3491057.1 M protein repeat protein [Arthroderma uncinatum]
MADAEEKARAEKLAAAKKRVAQLQKQKGKKGKKGESSKQAAASAEAGDKAPTPESKQEQEPEPELEQEPEAGSPKDMAVEKEDAEEAIVEERDDGSDKKEENSEESLPKVRSHGRQPSISVQSKLRSSSFRQDSKLPGINPTASGVKSPPLPLSPDGSTAPEMFRKQAIRLEELEKENKRLEKEVEVTSAKWKKSEEQLDDLREASTETVELKERLAKAAKQAEEVDKLKAEISALQRQNSHLQTRSHRPSTSIAVSGNSDSPASELLSQLDAKSAKIENMEMEISNLRAQLNSQSTHSSAHEEQISALEDKLSRSEAALEKSQRELADTKQAVTRAAEKAVKEGVDKTSTETLVKSLERQLKESEEAKFEADKKAELLEKKLQALSNLHKESESRHQVRMKERDKFEKDVAMLTRKLATTENENLRLKEERDRLRKREASGTGADEGLDELEDEERLNLERKVRDLEGEVFDLRRGIWKERKRELSTHNDGDGAQTDTKSVTSTFDDVDLTGGAPGGHSYTGRRSVTQRPQQHSSFATVFSSGLAAFTGTHDQDRGYKSFDYGSHADPNDDLLDDDAFDEDAFARAQEEEEAKRRVEWAREIKGKLKNWKGWRLDLVECRYGAQGAGVGLGEIFEA